MLMTKAERLQLDWIDDWMKSVTDASMTQRRLTTIERHGGVEALVARARRHGVHLAQLTDDQGIEIVVASRHPFVVLC